MNVRPKSGIAALTALAGLLIGLVTHQAYTQNQAAVEAGAGKSAVCVACHGMSGNSINPLWPNLAGQKASYIARQIKAFRDGGRSDPLMSPIVAGLSDADIADLAAYYSAQSPAGLEADPSYWVAGQRLYRGGDIAREVPACIACHGPVGEGNGPALYPALRAQHSAYTQKQLQAYADGIRTGGQAKIMRTIAERLSPEDMRNLASYLQGMR